MACEHCGCGTYAEHARSCPSETGRRQWAGNRVEGLVRLYVSTRAPETAAALREAVELLLEAHPAIEPE